MRKRNANNERIKRKYLQFLREAKQLSPKSVEQAAAAIASFEESTGWRDFAKFHVEQARKFKAQLADAVNEKTGKPLAKATIKSRLKEVKAFFFWLASEPGYRSKLKHSDTEYFNISANDNRIASAHREMPVPTLEQVLGVIGSMPAGSEIEMRDRAVISFALLTGARDDAIASIPIGLVDLEKRSVFQDARTVRTKNRKSFTTYFFPVGDEVTAIVADWIDYLTRQKGYGPDDPLFPATEIALNENGLFHPSGLKRAFWSNAGAIRRIFREAFEAAGLPYCNPHTIRKTLVRLGEQRCRTPEEFKAWSQNLGHEQVMTTFRSYGNVPGNRQGEIMARIGRRDDTNSALTPEARAALELLLKTG
ncbi:MAG: hypothetical protein Kow0026_28550 [Oricola sp.]